jgi:hypothetical protein
MLVRRWRIVLAAGLAAAAGAVAVLAIQEPPFRSAAVVTVSAAPPGEPVSSVAQAVRDVLAFEVAVTPDGPQGIRLPGRDELRERVRAVISGSSFATVTAEYEGSTAESALALARAALPAGVAAARTALPGARIAVAAGPSEPRQAPRPVLSMALAVLGVAFVVGILAAILADWARRCRASAG